MKVTSGQGVTELHLRGMISEIVELDASKAPPGRPVVMDVGEIKNMNSLGIRNWVRFLDALCDKAPQVVIRRLSPMLVFQASMISTFLSRARVESFLSPWCCVECEHTVELLHRLEEDIPQSIPCPKCKSSMEFDSDFDSYQTFRTLARRHAR